MSEITETLENISEQLQEAIHDAEKFDLGNNSAGTRVRKTMQSIKSLAQDIRVEIQKQKNSVAV